ncbi:MAG: DUF3619 family protein [Gallionella sp.]
MTNELNPVKIAQLLTQGTRQLNTNTISALADARQNALKRQLVRAPVAALSTGRWTHNLLPHSLQQWLVTGLLVFILMITAGYLQHAQEQQISELDVAILTDDLPIEVFVD